MEIPMSEEKKLVVKCPDLDFIYPLALLTPTGPKYAFARFRRINGEPTYLINHRYPGKSAYLLIHKFRKPFLVKMGNAVSNSGIHSYHVTRLVEGDLLVLRREYVFPPGVGPTLEELSAYMDSLYSYIVWVRRGKAIRLWQLSFTGWLTKPSFDFSDISLEPLQGHLSYAKISTEVDGHIPYRVGCLRILDHQLHGSYMYYKISPLTYLISVTSQLQIYHPEHPSVSLGAGTYLFRHSPPEVD